jgi:aminoglycoside/choline kinase family phosphotransferase
MVLACNLQRKTKKKIINEFIEIWKNLLNKNLKTKKVLVHRDFHIDNLFFLKDRQNLKACGLVDFQDAVIGPSSYDLISLLEDARRDVDKKIIIKMYNKFVKKLSKNQKKDFIKEYKVLAINRHLKVIGIFTRLYMRDKKKFYLNHIPRLWKLIEHNLDFYSLSEINKWINKFFPKKFRIKPKV